ncbi:hypothetical protein FA10DRAFT_267384 [Acaromyces ingoldii]|uniref:ABC transporter domain-containing protein n=1 Tax=Acaromyces ingoldii TaxID=215250 RepID=A0A316YN38_9BASI|nr:hypothetical protein FA10DRAFT_267384 [Acaromyces ingoldii]PWN90960.1 hypothetical protein FA10DRAFT_267384 [Acaromyces ingoldii]
MSGGTESRDEIETVVQQHRDDGEARDEVRPDGLERVRSNKSIPIGSLDPRGTASLTRQLTAQSKVTTTYDADGDDVEKDTRPATADPFDEAGRFDLETFLTQILQRRDEGGHGSRSMGLAFQDYTVTGIGAGVGLSKSIGDVLTEPLRIGSTIRAMRYPPIKTILHGFEGHVKPGEMLLVLGRPGSGCTTLLKSLASYRDGFRSITGTVSYQGFDHTMIDTLLRSDVAYCPEDDIHFPTLTVGQTLDFAAATRAPQARRRVMFTTASNKRSEYISLVRQVLGTVLGLRHTFNTKVGNELIRGVSGGEKKRVSVAEVMATRAKIQLWDNSSRGLDASTAVEFIRALRIGTDLGKTTTIASIYQAGESLTRMFDKVTLLYEGRQIFFGPVEEALGYFYEMGYEPHHRQTTADFLVSLTDPYARIVRPGFESRAPRTAQEFEHYWRESQLGKRCHEETTAYLEELRQLNKDETYKRDYTSLFKQDKAKHTRPNSRFIISWPQQIRLAIKRRAQVLVGDLPTQSIVIGASVFQALIIGSVFYKMPTDTSGFFSRGGVLFFSLLFNAFTAMTEVTIGYSQRPIVIRQNRFAMIHPSADALANTLLDLPIRFATILAFGVVIYYLTGLSYTPDAWFIFLFTVLLVTITLVAFFRMLAALTRSEAVATMLSGLAIIDMALYAGYVIPRPSMVVWWKWLSYCNPIAFTFEILMTNEFRKLKNVPCLSLVPSGPGYENVSPANQVCAVTGGQPGATTIDGSEYLEVNYGYTFAHSGRNAGITIAFFIFFMIIYCFASEWQKDPAATGGRMVFLRSKAPKYALDAAYAVGDLESDGEKGGSSSAASSPKTDADVEKMSPNAIAAAEAKEDEEVKRAIHASDDVFSWHNVNFDILIKGEPRKLLNNVSGYVAPGKLTALMGASGAGKTTLLNVLAQRVDFGVISGDFMVGGRPLPRSFQADTGYCQQMDTHLSTQTVREALQFSALLRQPAEVPQEEKLEYVETVIRMLEMEPFAEAIVGEVGEGLNVEQRKRLTIGVELAARPKLLLFLDEPTSGLDAQAAWSVVRFLRKLADAGQAILCTIHQPSAELFDQFDRLLLLKKGGETVYFGDLGHHCETLLDYFQKRSGVECGPDENPAEYILDVIGAGAASTATRDWHKLFLDSKLCKKMHTDIQRIESEQQARQRSKEDESRGSREYAASFATQLRLVTKRAFVHYWRSPVYLSAKLLLNLVAGLFIGSSFWGQGRLYSVASLQNKLFSIFMALVLSTSLSQQLQPVFISFRGLYEARERPSKAYSWPVMLFAALVVEIPWNMVGGTLFWLPWWFMIQFSFNSARSAYSWGALMLFEIYFQTFAAAMAALAANAMLASVLFSVFFSFVIVFCGVVQPPPQMPTFWSTWMVPLSPFTYLLEGLLGNVLAGEPVECTAKEANIVIPPAGQSCDAYLGRFQQTSAGYYTTLPDGTCSYCQYRQADTYLTLLSTNNFKLDVGHRFRNLGLIVAYIAFNVGLCFVLFYVARIHQWKGTGKKAKAASKAKEPVQAVEEAVTKTNPQAATGDALMDENDAKRPPI